LLDDEDVTDALGRPDVGEGASRVGQLAAVRERLVAEQQRLGRRYRRDPGVVLEGRDIGTVVFPDADVKIFMVADPEVRARRRQAELVARGVPASFDVVLAEILQRDRRDRERALSPLRKADDAVELDTTGRSVDAQVQFVIDRVRERGDLRAV
jgi:cytidylate kinase